METSSTGQKWLEQTNQGGSYLLDNGVTEEEKEGKAEEEEEDSIAGHSI